MPIIDDRTPNLNLPLPYADNLLEDDSDRLREALTTIDTAVAAKASAASVTAVSDALATKADLVAGKVPAGQLPSFVDDVVEVANYAALPVTGESGKIYVILAASGGFQANQQFRWTGTVYIALVASPGTTDDVAEGATNLYHTPARALAAVPIATVSTLGKVKIGAGLGIDGDGLLFASAGGGSIMSIQEVVPPSDGVSSITVPGGYVVGAILVAFNGAFLGPSDIIATDGTTIGLIGFTAGTMDAFTVVKLATVTIGSLPVGSVTNTQLAAGAAAANIGYTPANDTLAVHLAGAETLTGSKRGTITTDNDLSFDLNAGNDFKCTPAATGTLTFTNIPAAPAMQTGFILLLNTGGYAISAAATTKISASALALISFAGTYAMSYFSDGTNVYVNAGETV